MQNIKLIISYDGSRYAGWQRQDHPGAAALACSAGGCGPQKTVQGIIETALQKMLQKKIRLIGSGRTDAGVHALGQVANFKTEKHIQPDRLKKALNGLLPQDIVIVDAQEAPLDFHSRFCAKSKVYRYIILNSQNRPAFAHRWSLLVRYPLNVKLIKQESKSLVGRHDFKSFQASDKIKRNSITTIKYIRISKSKRCHSFPFLSDLELVIIDIEAEGFLYNMARNIVGTLLEVGRDRLKKGDLKKILQKRDRSSAGPCAPARGLYLLSVSYG